MDKQISKGTHHQKISNKISYSKKKNIYIYSLFSFKTSKLLKVSVTQSLQVYDGNNMALDHQLD